MLRVLSVTSGLCFGGDERRLLLLAQHINRDRFKHTIVCIRGETPAIRESFGTFRDQCEATGAEIIDLELDVEALRALRTHPMQFVKEGTVSLWRCVHEMRRIINEYDIHLIDAHVGLGNRIGIIAGMLTRRPVLVTVYDPTEYRRGSLAFIGYQMMLRCAAGVVTDDELVRCRIKDWMLMQPKRLFVIPSNILPPEPALSRRAMLRRYRISVDEGTKIVGMVANLLPFKGPMVFLEAAALVARSHPECIFLIAGFVRGEAPPAYVASLWRRAGELGIAERVRIISHPGTIGDVWQLIDIFVHPSMRDSVALSIMEGMSLGKPAVVTDIGGSASLVVHKQTGLVVRAGDAEALAAGVVRLLEHPHLAKALGDAALGRYASSYSCPKKMVRSMEKAFLEAAGLESSVNAVTHTERFTTANGSAVENPDIYLVR